MAISYRDILMEWIRIFIQQLKVVGHLNINHTHLLMSDKSSLELWGAIQLYIYSRGTDVQGEGPLNISYYAN